VSVKMIIIMIVFKHVSLILR